MQTSASPDPGLHPAGEQREARPKSEVVLSPTQTLDGKLPLIYLLLLGPVGAPAPVLAGIRRNPVLVGVCREAGGKGGLSDWQSYPELDCTALPEKPQGRPGKGSVIDGSSAQQTMT